MRYNDGPLADGLQLLALSGLALAAPLFDLLGRNPSFLVAHRATPSDIWILVGLLLFALPLAAWLVLQAAVRIDQRSANGLRWGLVAVLVAAFCLPALGRVPAVPGAVAALAAAALGVAVASAFARRRGVRIFVTVLAPLPLALAGAFVLHPRIASLLRDSAPVGGAQVPIESDTPVVVVVFDELPTTSLLDEDEHIDPHRYPNFAALAEHATWYRRASTVAASTAVSLPAILTGNRPGLEALATATDHPRNLFSMLGGSYDMHVHESRTFLFTGDREGEAVPEDRVTQLARDLAILYAHVLLPDDLASGLPDVTHDWKDFGDPAPEARELRKRERFRDRGRQAQRFIRAITPCEGGCLHFLHLMLPHFPWQYSERGRKYFPHDAPGLRGKFWGTEGWYVIQGYQRHLIQLAFVDRILGDLVGRLRATGLYDRALFVVTADHGAAFWPGQARRVPQRSDHPEEILRVPLLVKRPGQQTANIDDRFALTIDILPTIAALLDVELPWKFDGCALTDPACPERRELLVVSGEKKKRVRLTYPAEILTRTAGLQRKLAIFGAGNGTAGLFALGPYRNLVGRPVADLSIAGNLDVLFELSDASLAMARGRPDEYGLMRLIGRFPSPRGADRTVPIAVARNGSIRAVVPALPTGKGISSFSVMLPEPSRGEDPELLDFFAVRGPPASPELLWVPSAFRDFGVPYGRSIGRRAERR